LLQQIALAQHAMSRLWAQSLASSSPARATTHFNHLCTRVLYSFIILCTSDCRLGRRKDISFHNYCFLYKKAELSQRRPHDAPSIYGCPEKFRKSRD